MDDAPETDAMPSELWIRLGILLRRPWWRNPERYSHELISDDYWILAGRWDTFCRKISPARIHPRLGWVQGPVSKENPLGLVPATTRRLVKDGRPKLLCIGDSYIDGPVSDEDKLPQLLDSCLERVEVLNLGVGGYGTGQMHLLLRETLPLVDRPSLILVGVEQFSFDRAGLGVRSYQKPRLVLRDDGGLEVTNVPIDPNPRRFFRRAKLKLRSLREAALRMELSHPSGSDYGFDDKVAVNRAILSANQKLAQDAGADLLYVLFSDHPQLTQPDRRSAFFREELAARQIDFIDTGPILLAHAEAHGTDAAELYSNGHLTGRGNRIVAAAIASKLARLGATTDR
ncbi:MAG: hypothetical protein DRQ55_14615 [Planctomycetota bacterium]|nr:MAG: hypothetical protein DRQ55_14615 [Planctomycetota bacterium]